MFFICFTFPLISSVQVIVFVPPISQFSPPSGEVTVILLLIIVNAESEKSNIPASSTLVIFNL